jgi:hypothetical protein
MDVAEFTAAHWKVLQLSFDGTPVPYLIQEHSYSGFDTGEVNQPPAVDFLNRRPKHANPHRPSS